MSLSSWLWGTTQTDEAIDKATSELLPAGAEDMALNLEICDQIRSKAVPPKDAMKALKRRMNHRNPNVQLLTLGLTDVCIKNGGDHFLVEIASREFMDNLVSILKMPTLNHEVKTKILRLMQNWAVAFEGKPALGYVGQVYKTLKNEGFAFPPQDLTASSTAMVDTSTAPEWIDSDVCLRCRTAFSFTNRKHHCRNCGQVFDQACSSKMLPLPHFGITQEVRVCDGCYVKLTKNKKEKTHSHDSSKHRTRSPTRHKSARELADAELQRAIELSLAESGGLASGSTGHRRPGYVPAQPNPSNYSWQTSEPPLVDRSTRPAPKVNGHRKEEEEDDPELKAAIEASLKEANAPKPNAPVLETPTAEVPMYMYNPLTNSSLPPRTSSLPVTTSSSSSPLPSLPAAPQMQPAYDLSPYESSAILEFSQTVEAAETSGGRDLSRYAGVSEMYDKAQGLRPKLVLALGDAERKEQMLADMHDKLSQVVKLYDKALTEQVSRPRRSQAAQPNANTPQQQYAQWAPQQAMSYGPQQTQYAQPRQQFVQQQPTPQQQQYAPPPQAVTQVPESQYQQPQMTGQQQGYQWQPQPQAQQQAQFAPPVQQQFASPSSPPAPTPISQYNHPPVGMQSPPPPQAVLSPAPPQQVQFAHQSTAPQVQSPPPQQIQYATAAQILAPAPQAVQSPPAQQQTQGQIQGLPPPPQALQSPAPVPEAGAYPWQSMSPTLSRHNTVSYAGSQSAAPPSPTLTRHNTVTYGQAPTPASAAPASTHVAQPQVYQQQPQQQQQHYQSPVPMPSLPQFPVAPTSNPQAFSLYGSPAGGVEQTERKEALLIDL